MPAEDVLVLGATGLVGAHVVRELTARGHRVVAVSRRPMRSEDPSVRWVQADASCPEDVAAIPACPTAVSTLGVWLTAGVAPDLVARGLRRLVAFSSSSAVTKTDASDEGERRLAASLISGEVALLELAPKLTTTILRPTMIYGGPGDANVERIAAQLRRFGVFPLVGNGSGLRQPVFAPDLGTAAVQALTTSRTEGRTYTLAGGEVLTVKEMVRRVGVANGVRVRFLGVPQRPAEQALRLLGRLPGFRTVPSGALERMSRDLAFDNSAAMNDFGYAPRRFTPPDYRSAR